jgi:epsilon-lactone hydrolase
MFLAKRVFLVVSFVCFAGSGFAEQKFVPSTISDEASTYIKEHAPVALLPNSLEEWQDASGAMAEIGRISDDGERILGLWPADLEMVEIDGAQHLLATPKNFSVENEKRILIYVHGGAYVMGRPEDQLGSIAVIADLMKQRVLGLRYPLAWQAPHPAARDRLVAVYSQLLKTYSPRHIAMAGDSAGGGLVMSGVLEIRDSGLPMPAVVGLISPWADVSKTGDSMVIASGLDPLIDYDTNLAAAAKLYAGQKDLKDPSVSPLYADFNKGFPPAFISSGTRDLFLSHTARLQRKLTDAGVTNSLHVYEGMWHVFQIAPDPAMPEAGPAWRDLTSFIDSHLAR